jgi:nucleoside-diphosphate-sugar epimerase
MSKSKIVVLGANGQVGSEVCLVLHAMRDVEVVPVVRSKLGGALLERCGLKVRVSSLASDADAAEVLAGAAAVADFRLPAGMPAAVGRATREGVATCLRNAPASAAYVFMSTTMAFGMAPDASVAARYRSMLVARTSYAVYKRNAERYALLQGALRGRRVYVLRLGQVFGELQGVSRGWLKQVTDGPVAIADRGRAPSDAVFCSTIALALQRIAARRDPPGTYTLVEAPDWRWADVYAFHAAQAGVAQRLESADAPDRAPFARRAVRALAAVALRRKDFLVAHLLPPALGLQQVIKARHLVRFASSDIGSMRPQAPPSLVTYAGPVPGKRLGSLRDTWSTMRPEIEAVRRLLDERLGPNAHNYRLGSGFGPAA